MARFSEETIDSWRKPPSDAEETKLSNAQRLVTEAIQADATLNKMGIRVFGQGSYANDTNVRLNSDIDINVQYGGTFFYEVPKGKSGSDFGLTSSEYTFSQYKQAVETALVNKFGRASVVRSDKCITIKETSTRVEADVVPTFQHRRYLENGSYHAGAEFRSDEGVYITNFPEQHIENGKKKNASTQRRFKRLTRIYRRIRYKMLDDNIAISDNITSFLLECLVWNVPDYILNNNHTWTGRLKDSISHLYDELGKDVSKEWGEVSELLYLFHSGRKWTREDVKLYLEQMWAYLEF